MEDDKSKKCNQHQGRQFFVRALVILNFVIFTPDIYQFKISVIFGLLGL